MPDEPGHALLPTLLGVRSALTCGAEAVVERFGEAMLNDCLRSSPSRSRLFELGLPLCLLPIVLAVGAPTPTPTSTPAPQEPTERQCVAWWRFQNGVKNVAAVTNHLIEDSSGNDQHGLAQGHPHFRRVALPDSNLALDFAGDQQYLFVPDDELFQLTGSLTVEAYVEVHAYPGFASQIVFRGDDRGGFDPWFLRLADSGRLQFVVTDDRNESALVESPEPLPLNRWMHVAGTLDDATGQLRLYVDCVQVAATKTAVRAAGVLGGAQPGIGIGNLAYGGNQGFRGSIDEVRISAAALVPEQLLKPPRRMVGAREQESDR